MEHVFVLHANPMMRMRKGEEVSSAGPAETPTQGAINPEKPKKSPDADQMCKRESGDVM